MKIALQIDAVDWEKQSTYFLETVEFEGEPEDVAYFLSGFLANGEGQFQMVVKSMKIV